MMIIHFSLSLPPLLIYFKLLLSLLNLLSNAGVSVPDSWGKSVTGGATAGVEATGQSSVLNAVQLLLSLAQGKSSNPDETLKQLMRTISTIKPESLEELSTAMPAATTPSVGGGSSDLDQLIAMLTAMQGGMGSGGVSSGKYIYIPFTHYTTLRTHAHAAHWKGVRCFSSNMFLISYTFCMKMARVVVMILNQRVLV